MAAHPLLARLRRERRWAVALALVAAAVVAAVQCSLAPAANAADPPPAEDLAPDLRQ